MKKVSSREFQKGFRHISQTLKPGQMVLITKRGKPLGTFTKAPDRTVPRPDFLGNLRKLGYEPEVGESLVKKFHDSIS